MRIKNFKNIYMYNFKNNLLKKNLNRRLTR